MKNISGTGKIKNIKCEKISISVFPTLLFGTHSDGSEYFDATNYLLSKNQTSELPLSVEQFFKEFAYPIRSIVNACQIKEDNIVCINSEGHQLINGCLCYLFLSYVDPHFCAYCCDILDELFTMGCAISDSHLIALVKHRLSPDLLNQIWNDEKLMADSTPSTNI